MQMMLLPVTLSVAADNRDTATEVETACDVVDGTSVTVKIQNKVKEASFIIARQTHAVNTININHDTISST